jgi:hypothetical protein
VNLHQLKDRPEIAGDQKLSSAYRRLTSLIAALAERDGPESLAAGINAEVDEVNALQGSSRELLNGIRRAYARISRLVERELKLVAPNHYRTLWTGLGLAVFGIPIGAGLGAALGNMAFVGAGIPIGLAIGVAVGTAMDRKAAAEGRQLAIDPD